LDHATKDRSGVLKSEDPNTTSILGGAASGGFLNNNDAAAGIPLTTADGLVVGSSIGLSGGGDLFFNTTTNQDSTMFGKLVPDSQFISHDAFLQHNGVGLKGPTAANRVLVAQLTTRGQIKFELNLIVEETNGSTVTTYTIVAKDDTLGEILSPYLTYPPACGCTDKKYLEYDPLFSCLISDSCLTLKVFGCTDPLACNYDPAANSALSGYCCYPGQCQDRDLSLACPSISNGRLSLYPNPANAQISLDISAGDNSETKYAVYDVFGRLVFEKNMGIVSGTVSENIDLSGFDNGLYMIHLFIGDASVLKTFFKN